MSDAAELIRAIAELLRAIQWPLVALIVAIFFRHDLRKLIQRSRKWKLFGAEGEFGEAAAELVVSTEQEATIAANVSPGHQESSVQQNSSGDTTDTALDTLYLAASFAPRQTLLLLSDRLSRTLLAKAEKWQGVKSTERSHTIGTVLGAALALHEANEISLATLANVRDFWILRDKALLNPDVSDDDILKLVQSGTSLFRVIRKIPDPETLQEAGAWQ